MARLKQNTTADTICSFCGRRNSDLCPGQKMWQSHNNKHRICSRCVEICRNLLKEDRAALGGKPE